MANIYLSCWLRLPTKRTPSFVSTSRQGGLISTRHALISRGEHPNLTNEISTVVYQYARDLPRRLIERLPREQQLPNASPQLLRRIQAAPLTDESRLRNKYKKAIKLHLGLT